MQINERDRSILEHMIQEDDKRENIDLDKYINHGERLFPEDAQNYIRELRDEERV